MRAAAGTTLWELLLTLVLAGLVLGLAAPGFRQFVLDRKSVV